MARGRMQHRRGGLGLMPWFIRFFCVMALMFASVPGTVLPAHAVMPIVGGVASASVFHPCQLEPTAFMPQPAPSSPMAADGCCQGPFACSPCAAAVPGLLPPEAMFVPSSAPAGADLGVGIEDKLPGQVIPPAAPPPRLLA